MSSERTMMYDSPPPAPPSSPYVVDAHDQSFTLEVIERSHQTPVLVDCWAEWCAPCKTLGPTLERLAEEYSGRFILAKVNIDDAQQVAMAMRVQSVPFMMLFIDGRPVDALVGNQPEPALRAFLDQHLPPDLTDPYTEAQLALERGDVLSAKQALQLAIELDPQHGDALLALGRLLLSSGSVEEAMLTLKQIPSTHAQHETAQRILSLAGFADDVRDPAVLRDALALNDDPELWYQLGATLALQGQFSDACEAFLKVVSLDRSYRQDAGRAALLLIFDALGGEGALVQTYRRRLASLLF